MKVITIVGARPQFIKLAPVSRALRQRHQEIILHTGQHYDPNMSANFFSEMAIPEPDYNLEVGSGPHGQMTGQMLIAIERVLMDERPDAVVVIGDTNSTLAGALAATKLVLPVAHVEAGLRGYRREIPEEINRVLTDHLSTQLYCPTETAVRQLANEGITKGVEMVGDVMYDVVLEVQPRLTQRAQELHRALGVQPEGYALVTIHRPSNTDDPEAMRRIARALNECGMPVVFPVHPRTRKVLAEYDIAWNDNIHMTAPIGHMDLLALASQASYVVTDSGGVQKEAFLLDTPCVTIRDVTEWPETTVGGWNQIVGTQTEAILAAIHRPRPTERVGKPFGNGDAAERIAASLRA